MGCFLGLPFRIFLTDSSEIPTDARPRRWLPCPNGTAVRGACKIPGNVLALPSRSASP